MDVKTLTILYGSQTGTAQDISERLWREAKSYGFHGPVLPMDDYDIHDLIEEPIIVFICSTTGQGDQPDNMKKFWKFLLRKNLPNNSLDNLKYAVLGLGDSSYVKFNFSAKKLYKRLLQLGAHPLVEPGYADEQHDLGLDAIVHPWISRFWEKISELLPDMKNVFLNDNSHLFPPRWSVSVAGDEIRPFNENLKYADLIQNNCAQVTCIRNERVTSESHFQDTRLIKFKFSSKNLTYVPGDVLMIKPKNSTNSVHAFFKLFSEGIDKVHENLIIHISEAYSDMPVPIALQKPLLLKTIVEEYWDLNMVPRRYSFELLSHFTESDLEREKLVEFASTAGQEELYSYCNRPKRTILEVLADFPHATAKVPLSYFFELFQPIRSRAFSIASSPKVHPGEIHILVAVVQYKTNLKLPRIGLCSTWLASLVPNSEVVVHIRRGSFLFPSQQSIPLILVGPGTGIAPFRSYVQEESCEENSVKHHVIFGCRNENADFYFRNEWLDLRRKGTIQLYTAFSRDQSNKIYVQHVIERNGPIMCDLIAEKNASIFVAGNAKNMPEAVRKAFISNYAAHQNIEFDQAEKTFEQMELSGRYQTETWS